MPKAVIHGIQLPYGGPDQEDGREVRAVVELRWNKETGYFQMVTRCIDATTQETYYPKYIRDWVSGEMDASGEAAVTVEQTGDTESLIKVTPSNVSGPTMETDHGPMAVPFSLAQDGFWVDLDRRGINTLIRNLRDARDGAFGKDA